MKTLSVTKMTLTALLATNLLTLGVANASSDIKTLKKFHQTLNTDRVEVLEDPYYQIKTVKVRELSDEEASQYIDESENQLNANATGPNVELKNGGFTGVNVPGAQQGSNPGLSIGSGPDSTPVLPGPVAPAEPSSGTGVIDGVIMVIDKLIAVGQKITGIIKEGKSVVTNNPMSAVSVLPRTDLKDFVVHDMGGWSIPKQKHYKILFSNAFGVDVVSFVYSVSFQHNGAFNGKGKYLAGIRASARSIDIMWGFDIDATSQLIQISNVGTVDNVIAGATLEMTYTVKSWARSITTSESFHVTGDGKFYKLD